MTTTTIDGRTYVVSCANCGAWSSSSRCPRNRPDHIFCAAWIPPVPPKRSVKLSDQVAAKIFKYLDNHQSIGEITYYFNKDSKDELIHDLSSIIQEMTQCNTTPKST